MIGARHAVPLRSAVAPEGVYDVDQRSQRDDQGEIASGRTGRVEEPHGGITSSLS